MPELPEVETVRLHLQQALPGRRVREVIIRRRQLRQRIPTDFSRRLTGKRFSDIARRGKYLLLHAPPETCIVHLGMSGVLSLETLPPHEKHAHVALRLDDGTYLTYTDPRRFGLMTITDQPEQHPLLEKIGVEPLSRAFNGKALAHLLAHRKTAIKTALMDSHCIAGIGNIYAAESLFHAGIHPCRRADQVTAQECTRLAAAIKKVLRAALAAGGSSMRDFVAADGAPGYFQVRWRVYDRAGDPCRNKCGGMVAHLRQSGRSSYYCPNCQPAPEVTHG